jgi:hypothetical protein
VDCEEYVGDKGMRCMLTATGMPWYKGGRLISGIFGIILLIHLVFLLKCHFSISPVAFAMGGFG